MKTVMAIGMAGILAAAAVQPQACQAGQKEWATAGKILTGVVVAGILSDMCSTRTATYAQSAMVVPARVAERRYVATPCVARPPCPVRPWPRVTRCEPRVVECRPPVLECQPPVVEYRPPVPVRTEPIVVYTVEGQRLYQPAVHGHSAYVQVWSEVSGEWVSIREYPSIW